MKGKGYYLDLLQKYTNIGSKDGIAAMQEVIQTIEKKEQQKQLSDFDG